MTIKELRLKKKWSQSELAKRIGKSLRTIQSYEEDESKIPASSMKLLRTVLLESDLANIPTPQKDKMIQELREDKVIMLKEIDNSHQTIKSLLKTISNRDLIGKELERDTKVRMGTIEQLLKLNEARSNEKADKLRSKKTER